ncbi:heliorhodopsin HeR [Mobilitalea sibirica]|uniref:Heliorhodopsin HeR n=1 Tax=Mobilitalea sibirica TaxID=1462919 RepID=A0A8J7H7P1_9FIRM|nr:heliorhodopsin HeR [Mobilitalea sibirica]MBH1939590.1 heliorhodopsin HeR [Mobilitalea sibirica]
MKIIELSSLRRFNFFMGILHFLQGCFMLFVSLNIEKVKSFTPAILSYYLTFDTNQMRLVTDVNELFHLPFGILVSAFLFVSAIAHFIIVLPGTNGIYNRGLEKGINHFRWYEYSISSSIMIVLISVLFGVYDIGALILIFAVNASMNLFGLLMEKINQFTKKSDWSPFIYGTIAGIAPWIVILLYAFGNSEPDKIPWFVYAIVSSYFIFFNLFPINMVLQYLKVGRWKNYLYGEKIYIVLSLVAKSILAWLVFSGVMQPN